MGLRPLAQAQPHAVYSALFTAAAETLKGFGERKLKAELGLCAVLHTHNRRLDLHPHVHVVVPGGGIDAKRKLWRQIQGRYLFNAFALARVFRAKLLHALSASGLSIPVGLPPKWVVDCRNVGRGEPALEYLSRYLYRGVIRERDLVDHDETSGTVTFRYIDAKTKAPAYRQLPIADFLWHVLHHVLPADLRRVRDYGFLHGKAKQRLTLVQRILCVLIAAREQKSRPPMCSPRCQTPCASSAEFGAVPTDKPANSRIDADDPPPGHRRTARRPPTSTRRPGHTDPARSDHSAPQRARPHSAHDFSSPHSRAVRQLSSKEQKSSPL